MTATHEVRKRERYSKRKSERDGWKGARIETAEEREKEKYSWTVKGRWRVGVYAYVGVTMKRERERDRAWI